MLLQSNKLLPPPGIATPDFEGLALQASLNAVPNEWFIIPEQRVFIGLDDGDRNVNSNHPFGWDNEKPRREANVPAFIAKGRPITNGEYSKYLEERNILKFPASWAAARTLGPSFEGLDANGHINLNGHTNDKVAGRGFLSNLFVRTVFGLVPLQWALDWPLIASYEELESFSKWMNCRIPSFEEIKSLYKYAAQCKNKSGIGDTAAANGHL